MTEIIILVTGGFDPIHSGHLRYFERAKDFDIQTVLPLYEELYNKTIKAT